jgi:hypothetical protein
MTGRAVEADSSDLVHQFEHYLRQQIDSTRLPGPEAYDISLLTARVDGDRDGYERRLCVRGKRSIWQSEPIIQYNPTQRARIVDAIVPDEADPWNMSPDWYSVEFEVAPDSALVNTRSQAYFRTRDDRCCAVIIAGSAPRFEQIRDHYRGILASVRIFE